MFGWRATIGYINPSVYLAPHESEKILPEGVVWAIATLGVNRLIPEEFERAFAQYFDAAQILASREVDFIACGGSPVQLGVGYEKSMEMFRRIQETTGIPTMSKLTALINALNHLSVKKLVVVTPFGKENNERHKKHLEQVGFEVVNMKALGIERNVEISRQPPYASYRLAREAFRETPQADAIWIVCPAWPVLANIDILEKETGKPVLADKTNCLWAALTTLNIKGPIHGYGRLLEML